MNKTNSRAYCAILLLSLLLMTSCQGISEEQAISNTKEFVSQKVKFYTSEGNGTQWPQRAHITVLRSQKTAQHWEVYLHVGANQSNEIKESFMVVRLNKETGEIVDLQKIKP